ncbi:MAG: glyoxalase [Paracoccaceae bacterium]
MNFETVSAGDFGRSLGGIGLNLVVRDVPGLAAFLVDVFEMRAHRVSGDFAILTYGKQVMQIHADHTYHSNPLPSLIPEAGPRGGGIEIRLYDTDPDEAVTRADAHVHNTTILDAPANHPHGLREAVILCENGYAWLPSRGLTADEQAAVG